MPATIKAKCTTFDALLWGLYSGRIEMYTVTLHTAYHFTWVLSCCTSQQATPTLGNWWHYSIKPNPNSQNYNSLNMNSSSQSFVMLLQMHTLEVPANSWLTTSWVYCSIQPHRDAPTYTPPARSTPSTTSPSSSASSSSCHRLRLNEKSQVTHLQLKTAEPIRSRGTNKRQNQ